MATVSAKKFVETVKKIHSSYSVTYKNGASGQKSGNGWICDCRGLIIWALRLLGLTVSSTGTNWMIRNQMTSVEKVSSASQLTVGEAVFKSRNDKSKLPSKYMENGSSYDERFGEIDVYHVGVVVQTSPSLLILHCTSGGIKADTTLGKWNWAGWVKWVENMATPDAEEADRDEPEQARVYAKSGKTVNMRKSPNKQSVILKRVPIGSTVDVVSAGTTWCKVSHGGMAGYMMTEYLERG